MSLENLQYAIGNIVREHSMEKEVIDYLVQKVYEMPNLDGHDIEGELLDHIISICRGVTGNES